MSRSFPVRRASALLIALTVAASMPGAAQAAPQYRLTVLPDLGGGITKASQINDAGMVTGQSTVHDNDHLGVAFLLDGHRMVGLPQQGRAQPTWGMGVNASGLVVGWQSTRFLGAYSEWAFVWPRGGDKILLPQQGDAMAVNDDGVVVGKQMVPGTLSFHAYAWKDGVITDLGTADGATDSAALAINAHGDIAGSTGPSSYLPSTHAMVRFDGVMTDLGTFGFDGAMATGINASRLVCGQGVSGEWMQAHGFVWDGATGESRLIEEPVGTVSLAPYAINDAGVVVGRMRVQGGKAGTTAVHAFAWRDGVTTDLNDMLVAEDAANWVLEEATSINNHGQIVGRAHRRGTSTVAGVVLRPVH